MTNFNEAVKKHNAVINKEIREVKKQYPADPMGTSEDENDVHPEEIELKTITNLRNPSLPYVRNESTSSPTLMLVDSGAQSCFVPKTAVKDEDIVPINIDLVTPSGTRSDAIIGTTTFDLLLKDTDGTFHQFPFSAYVFHSEIDSSFILGCNFLRQNHLRVDLANNVMANEECDFPLIIGHKKVELSSTTQKIVTPVQKVTTENIRDDPKILSQLKLIQFLRENGHDYYFSNEEDKLLKNKAEKVSIPKQLKTHMNDFVELIETTQQLKANPNIEKRQH